ncbi:MBL fold metallo-hydrolase [Alteribacter natronophilus]|uniref:MBL fold metallo-hydrolase n=1 Tax=Alteribacter natronophilus TaxID=2583810 RepID=UPI00110ED28D|nr:MBL fold metallo-hydrolase [Alteribacter natronophilus]TMW72970.1 MBL fold metallo-hydrolase [Alteribacter natronophilus]
MSDKWFTVQKISRNTYAISEYGHWEKVHSFLLTGKEKACLIDTGLGIADIKPVVEKLTALPVTVVTTHVHWDHIGSHGSFDELMVHEAEREWLEEGIKGLPLSQIRHDVGRDITGPVPESFNAEAYVPFTGKPSSLLRDGDRLDFGDRTLRVIHTPGHSPGHICLYDETYELLFTGDLLYSDTPVYAFYPSTDPAALVSSWMKIADLNRVKCVFGSHNRLGLDASILEKAGAAARLLRRKNLDHFGTGVHRFEGFSVKF